MRWLGIVAIGLLLAGCQRETASLLVGSSETALTLERIKELPWSDGWDLHLIVRRNPECQRRHHLKPTLKESVKIEVFTPAPMIFILKQDKRWYVTDIRSCELQAYAEPPPEPGRPLGAFRVKGGEFKYIETADAEKEAAGTKPADDAK